MTIYRKLINLWEAQTTVVIAFPSTFVPKIALDFEQFKTD